MRWTLLAVAFILGLGLAVATLDPTGSASSTSSGTPDVPPGYVPIGDLVAALEQRDAARADASRQRALRLKWKRRHARVYRLLHPYSASWLADALCVKSEEGAWTANTGNGYYGGFQMDRNFQRAYGLRFYRALGTANRWHPKQQLWAAHRGWLARGWQPWPNTSRECGLSY